MSSRQEREFLDSHSGYPEKPLCWKLKPNQKTKVPFSVDAEQPHKSHFHPRFISLQWTSSVCPPAHVKMETDTHHLLHKSSDVLSWLGALTTYSVKVESGGSAMWVSHKMLYFSKGYHKEKRNYRSTLSWVYTLEIRHWQHLACLCLAFIRFLIVIFILLGNFWEALLISNQFSKLVNSFSKPVSYDIPGKSYTESQRYR